MKGYEVIEHTADVGIRVKAANLEELFGNAVLAVFDIIAEKKSSSQRVIKPPVKKFVVKQKADNLEELFLNWLNELLSLSSAKEKIFCDFKFNKLTEKELNAEVSGCDINGYKVNAEIKAATYHQLKVEKVKSGWLAEVIFDV